MTGIPNDSTLSGCIVLEKGTSWLARQIILHNRWIARYESKKHKQIILPLPYSHGEFLIWNEVERDYKTNEKTYHLEARTLYTFGSREKGADLSRVIDYYNDGNEVKILAPKVKLTPMDEYDIWNFFSFMDKSKYQWTNFLSWIGYIKTFGKLWIGNHGKTTTYCYELAARAANFIHRWKGDLDEVSVYDLYYNSFYKPLDL